MLLRLIILGLFVYYSYVLYTDPSIIEGIRPSNSENIVITKEAIKDVHDWGVSKIKR